MEHIEILINLWKLRLGQEVAVCTEDGQHVKGQGKFGDWHKVAVGNRDSKYMKEENEERGWQVGFRWMA
jgi:hypothetical protein